jgi:hypothetical protein
MNIVFNDQVYRLDLLATLGGLGHTVLARTADLQLVAGSERGTNTKPVCYSYNGEMHVLSGKLDPDKEMQDVTCVSKHVLRKALASQCNNLTYIAPPTVTRSAHVQENTPVQQPLPSVPVQRYATQSVSERTKMALAALSKGASQHVAVAPVSTTTAATRKALSVLEATLTRPQG